MRKISYKGKEINTGEWVYGNSCVYKFKDSEYFVPAIQSVKKSDSEHETDYLEYYEIDKGSLCEFIHRYDKNKKPIYENDIVIIPAGYSGDYHYKKAFGIIKYDIDGFYIESENLADDYNWSDIEVIGNTIENKELLLLKDLL